jgi:hypothetical protein
VWRARNGEDHAHPAEIQRAIVRADTATTWSERMESNREVVTLERGALWVHVEHVPGSRPLLVVLPDGELEDMGTTFKVNVDEGRTTRVAVEEGSVALRLHDRAPVSIGSRGTWSAAQVPVSSLTSAALPTEPVSSAASSKPMASAPSNEPVSSAAPAVASARSVPTVVSSAARAERDSSMDYQTAVSALRRGDDREAAAGFANFVANHPRDPRAEDAAYLRVIALQRCGDISGLRSAAQSYLRLYPTGFRHEEVASLSR